MRLRSMVLWFAMLVCVACGGANTATIAPKAGAAARVPPRFTLHEVAIGTWVLNEAAPWESNVLLAEMPDRSLLLVNAPATEAATRDLLGYIDARFGTRKLTAINSHHHIDSVGGNAVLLDRAVDVVASTETAALTARDTAAQRDGAVKSGLVPAAMAKEFMTTRIVPATHTFEAQQGLRLRFGVEEVRVLFAGAAHSADNVAIYFPSRGVVFGGCMVRSGDSLGPIEQADLQQWGAAIEALQGLAPLVVIPGHGIRYDAAMLENTRALLSAARESVAAP